MKKVIFFLSSLEEGGAQRVVSILSNNLSERDFDIEVLTYYNEDINYELSNKVKVVSVIKETNSNNILTNSLWIKKHFNKNGDIIVSFLAPFNMLALAINNKLPIIVADRNDPSRVPGNKIVRKLRDLLYKKANMVVLQTETNRKYFSYIKNTKVIYNPIDMKENAGLALRSKKSNKIVSVARLMPQKNQLMLIDAFNEIKDKYKDYKLVIYGEGTSRDELQKHIDELDLTEKIVLAGNSKDVFNDIKDAKIFVLSSNYEGMPNSLIEAMCLGLPVISTRVSGTEELIEDGMNGFIIDVNSKEQLVYKLNKLLEDEKLREEFGEKAIELNKKLAVDVISKQWIDCINEVLSE